MSGKGGFIVWITEDQGAGLALITGKPPGEVRNAVWVAAADTARWSASGHGWVIPLNQIPDLVACVENRHGIVKTKPREVTP